MSEIKKCFISRWLENGRLLETDFSQLEVIGVAHLSQDENLITDIIEGKDMHCMSASFLYSVPYEEVYKAVKVDKDPVWIARRKQAKGPSFQLQYGAGAKSIAASNKLTEEQANTFIANYYDRYSTLRMWQEENIKAVKASRRPSGKHTSSGYPLGIGYLHIATGRAFAFTEQEAPQWLQKRGEHTSFQPTQIKNYPSQGFATGDIVPLCVGELYYALKADEQLRHKALLINTVHDSVLLDVHVDVLDKAVDTVERVFRSAPQLLKKHFDIDFHMPLNVSSSVGYNWGEMEELTTKPQPTRIAA